MPSLSEVYEGKKRVMSLRRLVFGLGLFAAGSLLVVIGVVVATTGLVFLCTLVGGHAVLEALLEVTLVTVDFAWHMIT
mgnify:CR=1 FL=1